MWAPDAHEVHRELERCGRVAEDVGVDHERLQDYGAQQDHHHPQVRGDDRERESLYLLHGMLLSTNYSLRVQLASAACHDRRTLDRPGHEPDDRAHEGAGHKAAEEG